MRRSQLFGRQSNYGRNHLPPLSPKEFYDNFRFGREQIPDLCAQLKIPNEFLLPCRGRIDGEEALLLFLRRMTYPGRITDMMGMFHRSQGYVSETVEVVRLYLMAIAEPLVRNFDHRRIVPLLPVFAAAFRAKGCPYPNMWALYDGKFQANCRPGEGGYNGMEQRVMYNGHKKDHGLNWAGLETPDGIIPEMHGPHIGKANDKKMLADSFLLIRILQYCICLQVGIIYYIFGDRGYDHGHPGLMVPYKGAAISPAERAHNQVMSKMRQPVEWSFGKIVVYFAFIDFKKNQKIYHQPVASYFIIATFLTNVHSCYYGNHTSQYFSCPTPKLDDYLKAGLLAAGY